VTSFEKFAAGNISYIQDWILGCFILHICCYSASLGLLQLGNGWNERLKSAADQVYATFVHGEWEQADLTFLFQDIAWPMTRCLLGLLLIPAFAALVLSQVLAPSILLYYSQYFLEFLALFVSNPEAFLVVETEISNTSLWLLYFRAAFTASASVCIGSMIAAPLKQQLQLIHDSVRNEKYLIGRQLHDHKDHQPPEQEQQ